jgi:hypothetical protein
MAHALLLASSVARAADVSVGFVKAFCRKFGCHTIATKHEFMICVNDRDAFISSLKFQKIYIESRGSSVNQSWRQLCFEFLDEVAELARHEEK